MIAMCMTRGKWIDRRESERDRGWDIYIEEVEKSGRIYDEYRKWQNSITVTRIGRVGNIWTYRIEIFCVYVCMYLYEYKRDEYIEVWELSVKGRRCSPRNRVPWSLISALVEHNSIQGKWVSDDKSHLSSVNIFILFIIIHPAGQ